MTYFWHAVPVGGSPPAAITAVIVVPARGRNKYGPDWKVAIFAPTASSMLRSIILAIRSPHAAAM
jgi:hypothetical protein